VLAVAFGIALPAKYHCQVTFVVFTLSFAGVAVTFDPTFAYLVMAGAARTLTVTALAGAAEMPLSRSVEAITASNSFLIIESLYLVRLFDEKG
jgi:hypothetical protein